VFTFTFDSGHRRGRHALLRLITPAIAAGVALLAPAGIAGATTGNMPLSKPPIFSVSKAAGNPFIGRYTISAHSKGLVSGSLLTGWDAAGYLEGSMAIYAYFNGQEVSWVGTTYEYRYANGVMHIDLWDPDGTLLFGHAALRRSASGDLVGSVEFGKTYYSVTFAPAKSGQNIYNIAPGTVNVSAAAETETAAATVKVGIFSVALEEAQALAHTKG
jgi:hypothetical protein